MERVKVKLDFLNCVGVDCEGRSGGLALLWNEDVVPVRVLSLSKRHIDAVIDDKWRCTGFYGHPITARHFESWNMLRRLKSESSLPWIVGGDFNELLQLDEKEGESLRSSRQIEDFRDAAEYCELRDLGFYGPRFTWCNGQYQGTLISERLDRVLATEGWMALYPNARVINLVSPLSDHCSILLELEVRGQEDLV
ncbi:uncharacterized protein [Rutidosis leptorrhynchoides]|uniref:uncharacterized protein n=1 Tax=Rutidosis leptorrhynchoides TaxID=125765 RepID=UPI003A9A2B07